MEGGGAKGSCSFIRGQDGLSAKATFEQRPEGMWVAWRALNAKAIEPDPRCAVLGIARRFY